MHCSHMIVQIQVDWKSCLAEFTLENPIIFVRFMHQSVMSSSIVQIRKHFVA